MTDSSIQDRIHEVINSIQPTAKDADRQVTFKDLSWDSLDMVEMVNELEEEFDISITEDEAESLQTLQSVYDLVERKLAS